MSENSRKKRPNFKLGPKTDNALTSEQKIAFDVKKPAGFKPGSTVKQDRFQRKSFGGK